MDLFETAGMPPGQGVGAGSGVPAFNPSAPLAVRMRPTRLEEVLGQPHLTAPGTPLARLATPVRGDDAGSRAMPTSVFLWGPPGTGKTTLAYLAATQGERHFVELSAVQHGVKDLRDVVKAARQRLAATGQETVLFVDEVHRFSKSQQDALLPSVENRWVTLIAATTENPSFSVITPLLSRSILLTLRPLSEEAIATLLDRAVASERGLAGQVELPAEARDAIVRLSGGDARRALTVLEAAAGSAMDRHGQGHSLTLPDIEEVLETALAQYDRGDAHYDVASAFIKSMRGSDVDAALHYLARMLVGGEDPRFIARRVVIAASEEVGMADPTALQVAVAAAQTVQLVGMPECRIALAQAVVHVATAPKSNRAYAAINAAIADVEAGKVGPVPIHLRNTVPAAAGLAGRGEYLYAHDAPHGVVAQQYLPDELAGARYYEPTTRGREADVAARLPRLREILSGGHAEPK
ncbi:replication-associated recombination protein A [Buchananella felis]|uniref:replication-associated recombination protein A n=1 Tax=Buchananella felis TaxID=3231492 RepID=UPI0035291B19